MAKASVAFYKSHRHTVQQVDVLGMVEKITLVRLRFSGENKDIA